MVKYLIDSNILIEAHRRYYSFDICPGFWNSILNHHLSNSIYSIDQVRNEFKKGDPLDSWIKQTIPKEFFLSTNDTSVAQQYGTIMQKVNGSLQYTTAAKAEFADVADSWLVAFAKTHSYVLVTEEVYEANSKKKVKIPNVCKDFGVSYIDTFAMLRALNVSFT